ncbi:hypothetical protein COS55_00575 [Candidatus Shapirobacteria bacterium CG03_land_8_20_14_0_80_40_19]|uniref:Uncharacterized protein n=4 Tax=Candidatus Shapironibacteriota TaxID=1752721 RepID=A0A2M7BG56_9BACT|nr:MAG: hypothetical protein COV89_04115 [Candidatus Shapirobacteria bacterium CG11_big_fil_rev_8_21_14_0_20_40_12]PIV02067.1 MAG: hypothetical protein COS55_00575 [Candidatus Shapirobacteria bacterium CG03_land_8_20_14_0_80_40_19]PJC29296.1 MAG: hypothetical protein CO053_00210 [Candidatus Shapirobacteria bacterium CG_4_9_14_0_2_um_filter_40_11]PJC75881.1 MAG: hypothetical protein CO010_04125 [Candidatus Shapirobacteria bacterium CG_4_8_14_3_um_filter_39_11]
MAKLCEGCPRNCCLNFKLTQELFDPKSVEKALRDYPFIRRLGSKIVRAPNGREASVGTYKCDRFNEPTGECLNYNSQPRPPFCSQTGNGFYPHKGCLLIHV